MTEEIIVDNFAGGGGASTGIEMATGRSVDIAINHDPDAIAMHKTNHPTTMHYCESVWDVNPRKVANGRPVALVWLSPDCKHFSKAKGGKPVNKNIRGLAWIAIKWAATVKPRVIMLENVEEFKTWGPLLKDGQPCKDRKGKTFQAFIRALERQGYAVEHKELRACDFGAPTIRKRLFLIARRDGQPITWPKPTHYDPNKKLKPGEKTAGRKPYRTAAEIIDFSLDCPSIFERKRPLVENTLRRIAKGIQRYIIDSSDPFIVSYYSPNKTGGEFRGQPLSEPLKTQTTENRFALVNATLSPFITEHANASNQRNMPADEPLRTICAQVKGGHFALVAANLITLRNGSIGQPITKPLPTITAGGTHIAEVRAFLLKYYGTSTGQSLNEPLHTVTTKDRYGLVTVKGEQYQIADIGMRMLQPRELFNAQGFPADYIIDHDYNGKKMTKKAQVARCGNAVPPPFAEHLVKSNLPELCEPKTFDSKLIKTKKLMIGGGATCTLT